MKCHRDGVAAAEVDDVPILEVSLVDLLVIDVRPVRRIPVDEQDLPVDRNDLCVESRYLWILQYDLTNCRLPPDANPRAAEAELFAGAGAVEDREFTQHRVRGHRPVRGHDRLDRGCLEEDRKSTRLNSSHGYLPYAVFWLQKQTIA